MKLADFGISKRAEDASGPSTVKGTLEFMAPELLGFGGSVSSSKTYNHHPADMWALGEITSRLLTGEHTFRDLRLLGDYCRGANEFPSERLMSSAGDDPAQFVMALMTLDPNRRLNASDALHHPWMRQSSTDSKRDSHTNPLLDTLRSPLEEASSSGEPETEFVQEASGRWSTVSNAQIIEGTPRFGTEELSPPVVSSLSDAEVTVR